MPVVSEPPAQKTPDKVLWDVFTKYRPGWTAEVRARIASQVFRGVDPDDVIQAVAVQAHQRLRRFLDRVAAEAADRPDDWEGMAYRWLRELFRVAPIDFYRRQVADCRDAGKTVAFPEQSGEQFEQGVVAGGPTPSAEAAGNEVMRLVDELHPVDARIVRLRLTGLDFPAIADAVEMTADAANRRFLRAVEKLRKRCGVAPDPPEARP